MKITANQAAEILGISNSSVYNLIKQGKLVNLNGEEKGKSKKLDLKAVKEFKKEFNPKPNSISRRASKVELETIKPHAISERLKRLEEKIDYLIGIWQ